MTLTEALAVYVLIQEQGDVHDQAQLYVLKKAMEIIIDNAVAVIDREWDKRD